MCLSAITSAPSCTRGRSHSGLRVLIDSPSVTPACSSRATARLATGRTGAPGPVAAGERRQVAVVGRVSPRDVLSLQLAGGPPVGGEPRDDVDHVVHRHVDALLGERRDRPVADAARHDVLTHVGEVGGDVQGEAVHRAPVAEAHADRGDLARHDRRVGMVDVEPDTGEPVEPAGVRQAEFSKGVDEQALHTAHVRRRAEPVVDVQDRIADELTGAVIGDVAAALHRHEFGADRGRLTLQVVLEIGPHPVREHVGMLEQQQMLLRPVFEQAGLQRERFPVRHAAEPTDPERRVGGRPGHYQPGLSADLDRLAAARCEAETIVIARWTSPSSRGSP